MKRSYSAIVRALLKRLRQIHLYPKRIAMNRWWLRLLPAPPVEVLASEWLEEWNQQGTVTLLYIALRYDYNDRSRGLAYEEHMFANCLANMRDVHTIRLDFYTLAARYGQERANAVLKEVVLGNQIDRMLLLLYKDYFDYNLLSYIRDAVGIETILWLFDDDKRVEETKALVPLFSTSVTTIENRHQWRQEQGLSSKLCQFAANHFLYCDHELERDIDVIFIGQKFGNRGSFVEHLRANGVQVKTFGVGWGEGRLSQGEMINLLGRAKIALNFSSSDQHPELRFIKGRIFEIPATGAMLITETCTFLENYFDLGKEIEVFEGQDEMLAKVLYYLKNDALRRQIATAGKERVLREYSIERYIRYAANINTVEPRNA